MRETSGNIEVQRIAPGVVVTRMRGHATADHLPPIVSAVGSELDAGRRPDVFHDWELMTGYDSAVRVAITDWYRGVRDRVGKVHVLTSSRLVAMGVSVVSLAVGARVETYASRPSFERALAAAKQHARDVGGLAEPRS
jgi:hypothetical protein